MQGSLLGSLRDLALVLLAIELAVGIAVPGIIIFFALRGVRWVKRRIYIPLLTARLWALRIQSGTMRASQAAIALPVAVESVETRISATARAVAEWLGV